MLEIVYLNPEIRRTVVESFNRIPDVPEAPAGQGVDPGMREVVHRLNTISPRFVTISSCSGHGPPEIKGMHPGHLALWLADGFTPGLTDVEHLIKVGGISEVACQYRRFTGIVGGPHIRPLMEFWWHQRDAGRSLIEAEAALREWFGE